MPKQSPLKDPFADAEEAEFYSADQAVFNDPDGYSFDELDKLIDMVSEELDNV